MISGKENAKCVKCRMNVCSNIFPKSSCALADLSLSKNTHIFRISFNIHFKNFLCDNQQILVWNRSELNQATASSQNSLNILEHVTFSHIWLTISTTVQNTFLWFGVKCFHCLSLPMKLTVGECGMKAGFYVDFKPRMNLHHWQCCISAHIN